MAPVVALRRHTLYTVTVNEQLATRPRVSVACAVTVVTPGGNTEPDGGFTVKFTRHGLVTTGAGKVTTMPPAPRFGVPTTTFAGHAINGAGLDTVTEADAVLLPELGSGVSELTLTESLSTVPSGSVHWAVAMMVIFAEAPEASEAKLTERLLPTPPHTPPAVELQEKKAVPAGSVSLTMILTAVSGPPLCRVMLYVMFEFATTVDGLAVMATLRSLLLAAVSAANAITIPKPESRSTPAACMSRAVEVRNVRIWAGVKAGL